MRGPVPPTSAAIHADADELHERCAAIAAELTSAGVPAAVVASDGVVGGGGAPGLVLPGWAVALPTTFAERLRTGDPCVVGRVENDRCLLDLRCVPAERDIDVAKAVLAL